MNEGSTDSSLRHQLMNAPEIVPDTVPDDPGPHDTPPQSSDGHPDYDDPGGENGGGGGEFDDRDLGEIYPGCPVTALGVYGEMSWYLDVQGQLRAIDNHTAQKMMHVFGGRIAPLAYNFPQFDKDGHRRDGKFDQTSLSVAMMSACDDRGVWSPSNKVRGAGCWTDEDGNLIVHAGNAVLIDGEWRAPGLYQGKIYAADHPMPRPAKSDGRLDPAVEILKLMKTWNWRRPDIDPVLALGCICAMMLGGALTWRPVTWTTGDQATGKSTFQDMLLYILGGTDGLKQSTDATEAGIRSVVGHSCLPVALDELEPDDDPRRGRAAGIIKLARIAASGGQVFRGSTDQKGHQSNIYSCFLFSSILVPPMAPQDRSRLIQLDFDQLDEDAPAPTLDPRRLRGLGAGLRKRLIEGWATWPERLHMWRAALASEGQSNRGADNFGTALALADMVTRSELPKLEVLDAWAAKLSAAITDETVEIGSNAEEMINHLMGQPYDVFRRGQQYTIAQFVMAAAYLPGAPDELLGQNGPVDRDEKAKAANALLAKAGLRVKGKAEKAALFLPNSKIPNLCALFEGSVWADGVWAQAARRLPDAEPVPAPLTLAGLRSRGVYVPVQRIAGLIGFPTTPTARELGPNPAFPGDEADWKN